MANTENAAPGAVDDAEAAVEELPEGAERTSWGEVKHRGQCRYPWCRNPAEASEATTGRPAGFCDLEKPDGTRAHTKGSAFRERKRLEAEAAGGVAAAVPAIVSDADETRPHQTASLRGAALLDAVRADAKAEHAAAASRLAKWEHLVEQLMVIADPEAAGVDIETVRSAAAEEVAKAEGALARETKARISAEEKLAITKADLEEAEAAIVEFDAEKTRQLQDAQTRIEAAEAGRDAAVAEAEAAKTKAAEDIAAAAEANRAQLERVRAEAAAAVKAAQDEASAKAAAAAEASRLVQEKATADVEAARAAQAHAENEKVRAETRAEMEKTAAERAAAAHAEQLDQLRSAGKATAEAITATAKANEDRAVRAEAEADRLSKLLEQLRAAQADKPAEPEKK